MSSPPDAYKILQVDHEAEDEVIVAAYRRLARKYHPDVAPGPEAAARMAAINAAWELIGEPARRAAYDLERALRTSPQRHPSPGVRTPTDAPGATRPHPGGTSGAGPSHSGNATGAASQTAASGTGAAGPPPGNPSGSVLNFGRYAGWSLGEIARRDVEYIEWLDRMPIGRPYRDELDALLRKSGRRRSAPAEATDRRGLFRRR